MTIKLRGGGRGKAWPLVKYMSGLTDPCSGHDAVVYPINITTGLSPYLSGDLSVLNLDIFIQIFGKSEMVSRQSISKAKFETYLSNHLIFNSQMLTGD